MKKVWLFLFWLIFSVVNLDASMQYTREKFATACKNICATQLAMLSPNDTKMYISFNDSFEVIISLFFDCIPEISINNDNFFNSYIAKVSSLYFQSIYLFFNMIKFGAPWLSDFEVERLSAECPIDRQINDKIYQNCILQGVQEAANQIDTKKIKNDFLKTGVFNDAILYTTITKWVRTVVCKSCAKKNNLLPLGSIVCNANVDAEDDEATKEIISFYVQQFPHYLKSFVSRVCRDAFATYHPKVIVSFYQQDQLAGGLVSDLGKQIQAHVLNSYKLPLVTKGIVYSQILAVQKVMGRKFDLYDSELMNVLPEIPKNISADFERILNKFFQSDEKLCLKDPSTKLDLIEKVVLEQWVTSWCAKLSKNQKKYLMCDEGKFFRIIIYINQLNDLKSVMVCLSDIHYKLCLEVLYHTVKTNLHLLDVEMLNFEYFKYMWIDQKNEREAIKNERQSEFDVIVQDHNQDWKNNSVIQKQLQDNLKRQLMMQEWKNILSAEHDEILKKEAAYDAAWINEGDKQAVIEGLVERSRKMQATIIQEQNSFQLLKQLEQKKVLVQDYIKGRKEIFQKWREEYKKLQKKYNEALDNLMLSLVNAKINPDEQQARDCLYKEEQESFMEVALDMQLHKDAQARKAKLKQSILIFNDERRADRKSIEIQEEKTRNLIQKLENVLKATTVEEQDAWNLIQERKIKYAAIVSVVLNQKSERHLLELEELTNSQKIYEVLKRLLVPKEEDVARDRLERKELEYRRYVPYIADKKRQQERDVAEHGPVTVVRKYNPYA